MKIAVLTSTRADYGIYQPLLREFNRNSIDFELIVFGTHLSEFHGYTIKQILDDGYTVAHKVENLVLGDSPEAISSSMALTALKFSGLWATIKDKYDLTFILGDRYEMFAAVSSAIPFNISFAHIHGGEKTLGAIDNIFRHSMTQMAEYHFTSNDKYKSRVLDLIGNKEEKKNKVYNVGSLSLDNLKDLELFSTTEMEAKYGIDLNKPTILLTFHPETVNPERNSAYVEEIVIALEYLKKYQVVITMPNADTGSNIIRSKLNEFITQNKDRTFGIETFGIQGYFSCMEHSSFIMGNSSSGIIEAASFAKYVIDLGNRQKGRAAGDNVIHVEIESKEIINAVKKVEEAPGLDRSNIYWQGGAAESIVNILKNSFDE